MESIQIIGSTIGQAGLGIGPYAFVGVQLRGVGREEFEMEAREATAQRSDRFTLVDRGVIEHHDHVPPQVAQQMAEEIADVGVPDVVAMAAEVKSYALAHRTDRESRDDREAIVPVAMVDPRRLSPWRPRPPKRGNQEEPRLVDEDEVRLPARCVFFTCGQRVRFQRPMRSSSRSSARRSGFWGLSPI